MLIALILNADAPELQDELKQKLKALKIDIEAPLLEPRVLPPSQQQAPQMYQPPPYGPLAQSTYQPPRGQFSGRGVGRGLSRGGYQRQPQNQGQPRNQSQALCYVVVNQDISTETVETTGSKVCITLPSQQDPQCLTSRLCHHPIRLHNGPTHQ